MILFLYNEVKRKQERKMHELINDPFYETIRNYDRCIIDYCLMENDAPCYGESSHKTAVLFAILKTIERYLKEFSEDEIKMDKEVGLFEWNLDIGKAKGTKIDPNSFLKIPKILSVDFYGNRHYDCKYPDPDKGDQIPYWYAFLETPHISGYTPEDFCEVNASLFPEGTDELEIYEWTTDWSNYFDDGHEWWGTACWSVYDRKMNRYVVILASATD